MGIITEEMLAVVNGQRLGFVATVCADGTPNLSPKGTTLVWDADHLVFADICSPTTMENLAHNPAVEINVVDPIRRKGYRFKGRARIVGQGEELAALIAWYRQQGVNSVIRSVVVVEVTQAAPLISPAYDNGATEEEVSKRWETYYRALREIKAEQLKEAVDLAVQKLTDEEQNKLAQYILNVLEAYEEEKEWDAIVKRPEFLEKMEKLMHESLASGTEDGGFCP